ncbi:hypothetical protein N7492_003504 [Penicillium capsulatum]|uniref:Uncharacterized protein n=1 Tax=Penicillium capsulatum TaxID=69766 RepID=A0A9W9LX14_9EURO|nr:hypothetical protein N7492_003504 [Penicillium capsulatum]KAJ6121912.1 hypothetical protein N7512_004377 [Penicillium capsulatum]
MWSTSLTATLLLVSSLLAAASPISSIFQRDAALTEAQMIAIAPKSKTCDDPPAKGECATAQQAAKFTSQSFETYKVTSKAEQAAIVSLMAFESGDFKYNKNHFPGTPGQGSMYRIDNISIYISPCAVQWLTWEFTARNMQSPAFNKKYASSIPDLKDQIAKVANSPADLLDLLRENETYDFGSGAWFLTTQCSQDVRSALREGSETGWQKYISDCVGTSVTDERKAYWERATKALGVTGA